MEYLKPIRPLPGPFSHHGRSLVQLLHFPAVLVTAVGLNYGYTYRPMLAPVSGIGYLLHLFADALQPLISWDLYYSAPTASDSSRPSYTQRNRVSRPYTGHPGNLVPLFELGFVLFVAVAWVYDDTPGLAVLRSDLEAELPESDDIDSGWRRFTVGMNP